MKEVIIGVGLVVAVAWLWGIASEYFFGEKDDLDDYEDEV